MGAVIEKREVLDLCTFRNRGDRTVEMSISTARRKPSAAPGFGWRPL
jgi:hypothetical protein